MNKLLMTVISTTFVSFAAVAAETSVQNDLARRQARSVHLQYMADARSFSSIKGTVTVTETQPNSYFCLIGWNRGYCGIQDKGRDGRVIIFSVWDPVDPFDWSLKPESVKEELRAKVLYSAPNVDVARFGGEGSGARTLTPYAWKVGESVTLKIDSEPDGEDRTAYTCSFKDPKSGEWTKLATISTLKVKGQGDGVSDCYSFVEDFWRNRYSATISRRAEYSNIMVREHAGEEWKPITRAFFSADSTPSFAIDAGRSPEGKFFLQTGGKTKNEHAKLWSMIN